MRETQDKNYSYDGSVLFRARKRLKINIEVVSKELTLSVSQIKSVEENLDHGYSTPYFRKLAIERYAKILNVSIHKVIFYEEIDSIILDPLEASSSTLLNNFFNRLNNTSTIIFIFIFIVTLFISYFFFLSDEPKNTEKIIEDINIPTVDPESFPIITPAPKKINNADNLTEQILIDIPSQPIINTALNFICTIQSSPVTSFTTKIPDKPSSYFHIESLADQSICTVDSDGNLKTYTLAAGDKLTHRGKPPFKIQLDPTVSTLYFQGWIVYLKASNKFIQLDPALTPLTD